MIGLKRSEVPTVLETNSEQWNAEYAAWRQSQIGPEPRQYALPEIRQALEDETHSKCAYCEGRIDDVSYTHIEHKLPKKTFPHLVCDWDNLTIACTRCNTNKGTYDDLECQLLDPHTDPVEEDVAFGGNIAIARGGPRALMTITTLKLNRKELLYSRYEVLLRLIYLLDLIERAGPDRAPVLALWAEVDQHIDASAEFASAARYFLVAEQRERGLSRP